MRTLWILSALFLLTACGRDHDLDRESSAGGDTYEDSESLTRAENAATKLLGSDGSLRRAAWDNKTIGSTWSKVVLEEFRARKSNLEQARDIDDFCPAYDQVSDEKKETCWLRILSAMAYFESGHNPQATYREHTGGLSVGLLMMNAEHCPNAPSETALKNGESNIRCAFVRMEKLILRDQAISGPTAARGAAAYWSVLRPPYRFRDLSLGKKPHLQKFTKSYLAFNISK
jgi:hypothetical protein